ncbi:hypothetical protein AB0M47_23330 [Hamadaea sp. NPDC051192]|uniref:hypothetical protein n=1 Tax=Hamadaea sp. NPDC051192 TaxID=3154940 RepID=UPI00343FC714
MKVRRARRSFFLAVVLTLASCGSDDYVGDPEPTSPPGPRLAGRIIVLDAAAHRLLAVSAADGTPTVTELAPGTAVARISPDRTVLARLTLDGALALRNLVSGAEQTIDMTAGGKTIRAGADCLTWAPDGKRLAVQADGALYVTTLAGVATKIDERKTETYYESNGSVTIPRLGLPAPDPTSPHYTVSSEIGCAMWIDPHRLAFGRVITMPASVTVEAGNQPATITADTTTVARIGDTVALADSPARWEILDSCGTKLITRPLAKDEDRKRFVVDGSSMAGGADALPAAGELGRDAGASFGVAFIPGTCDILVISQTASTVFHRVQRREAATGAFRELSPVYDDDGRPPLGFPGDTIIWGPGADPAVYANTGGQYAPQLLQLHDLATGGMTAIKVDGRADTLIGWLP